LNPREHLLQYFSDGLTHSPTDLDREVLGIHRDSIGSLITGNLSWQSSPYCAELAKLIDEGLIRAYTLPNGCWRYSKI
jgi:hypothetical protein